MSRFLTLRNRQRSRKINLHLLRRIASTLLRDQLPTNEFDLGIYIMTQKGITLLNEKFLRHAGSTDVITFNHAAPAPVGRLSKRTKQPDPAQVGGHWEMHGEIFVCLDEAVRHARRFRTTWQSELTRYVIHGVLHLRGYDDQFPADRHKMKREEDRLLEVIAGHFPLSRLGVSTTLSG